MKKLLLKLLLGSLILLVTSNQGYSQTSPGILGPDDTTCLGGSYTLVANLNGFPGGGASSSDGLSNLDDWYSTVINIGFPFTFFGNTYTQCLLSTNGYITFNLTNAGGSSPWVISSAIPSSTNPTNSIMGAWMDLFPPVGGLMSYGTFGTAPNRYFIFDICSMPMFSCTTVEFKSQIVLYETSNNIEIYIAKKNYCAWNGDYAIEGIQNASGTVAYVTPGRNFPSNWTATNDGYKFTPTSASTYTGSVIPYAPKISPSIINWYLNGNFMGTGDTMNVNITSTSTVVAQLAGCDTTLSIDSTGMFSDTMLVYVVPPLTFTTTITPPSCTGGNNGIIHATSTDPFGPFQIQWTDASYNILQSHTTSTSLIDSLTSIGVGIYHAYVQNRFGCIDSATINVTSGAPVFFINGNDSICLGQNSTLTAVGNPPNCGPSIIPCGNGTNHNIGTFNSATTASYPTPFTGGFQDGKRQLIFTQAELVAAGMVGGGPITELAFNVYTKNSTQPYSNFSVKMGCIPTTFTSFTTAAWNNSAMLTSVYSSGNFSTTTGFNTIFLTTPYDWDGVSNLMVEICFDNTSSTGNDLVYKTNLGIVRCIFDYGTTALGCSGLSSPITSVTRPDIRFRHCAGVISPTATYNWTIPPSASSIGTSASITVSPTVTTTYQCTVTDNNCFSSHNFVVNQLTVNSIYIPDTVVCTNGNIVLHPTVTGPVPPYPLTCGANSTPCTTPVQSVVGLGTDASNIPSITTSNTDGRMLFIYSKNDLIAGGVSVASTLKQLAFNILTHNTTGNFQNLTIKVGCLPLNSSLPADFYPSGTLTTVYGPANFTPVLGWNNFNLTTTYDWNGNSDLAIEICYNNVILQAGALNDIYEKTITTANTAMYAYVNSPTGNGCSLTLPTSTTSASTIYRPNCRFGVCAANTSSYNYTWNVINGPGTVVQGCPNDVFSIPGTTTIVVQLQGTSPCIVSDTFIVSTANNTPIHLGNDTTYCSSVPLNIVCNATGAPGPFNWSALNGSTLSCATCNSTTITLLPGTTDTVIAHYAYASGCDVYDTLVLKVHSIPSSSFSVTSPVCVAQNSVITYTGNAGSAATYNWNFGTGAATPGGTVQGPHNVNWATSGKQYINLTVTDSGCTSINTIDSVTVAPTPVASALLSSTGTLGAMAAACWNDSVLVTFNGTINNASWAGPTTYLWNFNGGIIQNAAPANSAGPFEIKWNTPGKKYISLSITQDGCTSLIFNDSVYVTPILASPFSIAPYPSVCAGSNVTTSFNAVALAGLAYTWTTGGAAATISSGQGTQSAQIICNTAGVVQVHLQVSLNGCTSPVTTDSILVWPIPTANFSSSSPSLCSSDTINLTYIGFTNPSGGPITYAWNFVGGTVSPGGNSAGPHQLSFVNSGTSATTQNVTLTVTQNGCSSASFTLPITVYPIPVAALSTLTPTVCSGSPCQVSTSNSTINTTNGGAVNYNWSFSTIPSGALPGAGPQNFVWTNSTKCPVQESVSLNLSQNGCTSPNTSTLNIIINALPISSFNIAPTPICQGITPTLLFNGTTCTNGGVVGFAWNLDGGALATGSSNTGGPLGVAWINNSNSTAIYHPSLIITQDGCSSVPFSAPVSIFANPNVVISGPSQFCDGEIIILNAGAGYDNYLWNTGSSNSTIQVNTDGTYVVNIVDANGCDGTASKTVYSNPIPVANAGTDVLIFKGNSTMLNATGSYGGTQYVWSPKEWVDQVNSAIPYAAPTSTTPFILTYTNDITGCSSTDTVLVKVRDCQEIFIPNAFTPNNDGVDDYFMVLNPENYYRLTRFEIYNRWGNLMYSTNDKNGKGWDGKCQGIDQESGTYMYSVIAECGGKQTIQLKGDVTLVR